MLMVNDGMQIVMTDERWHMVDGDARWQVENDRLYTAEMVRWQAIDGKW
jgi:hypothetical protein